MGRPRKRHGRRFLSRNLTLNFRSGETRQYWRFGWGEQKKVRQVVDGLRAHVTGESAAAGGMVSLCPNCLAALAPRNYKCQSCGVEFKDEKTLWRRALVVPGGASLCVGANALGVLRAIFEAILSLSILISLVGLISAPRGSAAESALVTSIFVECAVLFVDKLLAYYLALRKFAISSPSSDSAQAARRKNGPPERAMIDARCPLNLPTCA